MFLKSLEINNYRSLEHVRLEDFSQFNVLIGRNNSGKSSVFGALELLGKMVAGQESSIEWERVLTAQENNRSLQIALTFEPLLAERETFLSFLRTGNQWKKRKQQLLNSPILSEIMFIFRSPPQRPDLLHLAEISLLSEDGSWATVQKVLELSITNKPTTRITRLQNVSQRLPAGLLNRTSLDVDTAAISGGASFAADYDIQSVPFKAYIPQDRTVSWLRKHVAEYLENSFFFNPFRHSTGRLEATEQSKLTQDGSNLAQVLKTIEGNNRSEFQEIESFVHDALPDVGTLHVPFVAGTSDIEVDFRSPVGNYRTRLGEMGGGIE